MPSEPTYQTQLRDLLLEHFGLPDLIQLAFELGINLDDVRGEERPTKAQELVARLGREGKLHKLVALCRQKRPHVFWPDPSDEPATAQLPIYGPLPPIVPHFVGRQEEITWLQNELRPGRVVVLCAAGGMGKTSVAVRAVRGEQYSVDSTQYSVLSEQWTVDSGQPPITQLPLFPDGILFYSFYGKPSPQAAMEEMCRWLNVDPRPDAAGVLRGLLARRKLLLLLDGAEVCEELEAVLAVRGRCGVLVTTRDREQMWGCDAHRELEPLPDAEAVQMLQGWGGQWAADTEAVGQICQLVGSLPLAVQLVGNYLAVKPMMATEYLAWLRRSPLQALHWRQRRDQSVGYLLGRSLAAVGEAGRGVLSAVGVLALAPFPAEVVQVAGLPAEGLEGLVRYGLVVRRGMWYEVSHALVYTYAHEQLPAAPGVVAGLAGWLSQQAESHSQRGLPGYQQLEPLRPHILTCLAACQQHQLWSTANDLVWLAGGHGGYLDINIRNYTTEWCAVLEIGIRAANMLGNTHDEIVRIGDLGNVYFNLGQVETAISYYRQALSLAQEVSDRQKECKYLGSLGNAYYSLGQKETAVSHYQQALNIAKKIGDKQRESRYLGNLGNTYSDLGQIKMAVSYYQQALSIAQEIGDEQGEGIRLGNLGSAYHSFGKVETAISYYQQALSIVQKIGDKEGESNILGNLGVAYWDLGQTQKAKMFYQQALVLAQRIGSHRGAVLWSWNLGLLYEKNDPQQAVELMSLRVAYEQEIGHPDAEKHAQQVEEIISHRRLVINGWKAVPWAIWGWLTATWGRWKRPFPSTNKP